MIFFDHVSGDTPIFADIYAIGKKIPPVKKSLRDSDFGPYYGVTVEYADDYSVKAIMPDGNVVAEFSADFSAENYGRLDKFPIHIPAKLLAAMLKYEELRCAITE